MGNFGKVVELLALNDGVLVMVGVVTWADKRELAEVDFWAGMHSGSEVTVYAQGVVVKNSDTGS